MTAVLGCSMDGILLPPQLLYEGSTERCHPVVPFPEGWNIHPHFITAPAPDNTPGLVVMDVFRADRTPAVLDILASSNLKCVFVPANCTSEMQVREVIF